MRQSTLCTWTNTLRHARLAMHPSQTCKRAICVWPRTVLILCLSIASSGLIHWLPANGQHAWAADDHVLPVDPAWNHPRFITTYPGEGQIVQVDPPRLSWSYLPQVAPGSQRDHPVTTFQLQIADNRFRRRRLTSLPNGTGTMHLSHWALGRGTGAYVRRTSQIGEDD